MNFFTFVEMKQSMFAHSSRLDM